MKTVAAPEVGPDGMSDAARQIIQARRAAGTLSGSTASQDDVQVPARLQTVDAAHPDAVPVTRGSMAEVADQIRRFWRNAAGR